MRLLINFIIPYQLIFFDILYIKSYLIMAVIRLLCLHFFTGIYPFKKPAFDILKQKSKTGYLLYFKYNYILSFRIFTISSWESTLYPPSVLGEPEAISSNIFSVTPSSLIFITRPNSFM